MSKIASVYFWPSYFILWHLYTPTQWSSICWKLINAHINQKWTEVCDKIWNGVIWCCWRTGWDRATRYGKSESSMKGTVKINKQVNPDSGERWESGLIDRDTWGSISSSGASLPKPRKGKLEKFQSLSQQWSQHKPTVGCQDQTGRSHLEPHH